MTAADSGGPRAESDVARASLDLATDSALVSGAKPAYQRQGVYACISDSRHGCVLSVDYNYCT